MFSYLYVSRIMLVPVGNDIVLLPVIITRPRTMELYTQYRWRYRKYYTWLDIIIINNNDNRVQKSDLNVTFKEPDIDPF